MTSPVVRVGIVSWNTATLLDACLAALPRALEGVEYEVVVVDNCSDDASAEVAARYSVTLITNPRNVGYARAMNQALTGPGPQVLIALNPDTVPGPGSLARLALHLLGGPADIGLLAPRLRNPDGSVQHSVYRFPTARLYMIAWFAPDLLQRGWLARRFWLDRRAPHDRDTDVDWVIGAVHAIRRAAIDERGPYDERWFMYVEDLDLCWRLDRGGWRRRLDVSAEVTHIGNAAGAQAWGGSRTERYMEASYAWYRREHGPWAVRLWALVNIFGKTWWCVIHAGIAAATAHPRKARVILGYLSELRVHRAALLSGGAGPDDPRFELDDTERR